MSKISFIGAGNMGSAIISGMINSGLFDPCDINVCEKFISPELRALGVNFTTLEDAINIADYVILAVKPNVIDSVLNEIKTVDGYDSKCYMSIAAGKKIEFAEAILGKAKIIRLMPNICLKAGEGMTVMCANDKCTEDDIAMADKIFSSCGKVCKVGEHLIDACTAINGSGPAYVFMFIEALADGAVLQGIDRETAYLLATQTVLGSAKLAAQSGIHPAQLKDMVCSPGGTTIEAVSRLEELGMRNAVISAVDACAKKAQQMGK